MRTVDGACSMMVEAPPCKADERVAGRSSHILPIIRGEFAEMPGLQLTRAQFRRLWNLTIDEGDQILDCLLLSGYLVEGRDGLLRRRLDARR
jgi:hypothetical protein